MSRYDREVLCKETADRFRQQALRELNDASALDAALAGDCDAVWDLQKRNLIGLGLSALSAYWGGTALDAYQELLGKGWSDDWHSMMESVGRDCRYIRRLFRAGQFEHSLDDRVRIYRGVMGLNVSTAAKGLSWSTERDVACHFAHAFRRTGEPLVITAEVDASEVLFYEDNRFESEVIPARTPRAVADADASTWEDAAIRYAEQYVDISESIRVMRQTGML